MPPKQNYTRDMVLQAAYKLTRENGFETVNARSLAKELGSSTQPIYSWFDTMEELKTALYTMAAGRFMDTVSIHKDEPDFLMTATKMFIQTAIKERHLFRLIYLSQSFDHQTLPELFMQYEVHQLILVRLISDYQLSESQAQASFYKIWFFIFGISTMLANNKINIQEDEIYRLVRETVNDLLPAVSV